MLPVLKSQDKTVLHFSALFDSPLNHPTLFSSQRTKKPNPWVDMSCLSLFYSHRCHAHSIYLHVVNWTVKDLGGLLSIRHSARSSFWILKRLSPWSNSFGFEALPIWNHWIYIVIRLEEMGGHITKIKIWLCLCVQYGHCTCLQVCKSRRGSGTIFFVIKRKRGMNHWQIFYHLVVSNLYTYFGTSINTLICCCQSMRAVRQTFFSTAAISTGAQIKPLNSSPCIQYWPKIYQTFIAA